MAYLFGWWDFDPEGPALINRKSHQRVVFEGVVRGIPEIRGEGPPAEIDFRRFLYEDSDVRYPLVVNRWRLDHALSAQLWQRGANADANHPSYGLWRRVDDCALDALFCWPELEATGQRDRACKVRGGWLNGAWDPGMLRTVSRGSQIPDANIAPTLVEPIMEPLDTAPPPPWHYVDAPEVARHAALANVERRPNDVPYLPADAALTGFEHHMPHLRRADGSAVIFPSRYASTFRNARRDTVSFVYADADIFLTISTDGDWHFRIDRIDEVGLRQRNGLATTIVMDTPGFKARSFMAYPRALPLWRRFVTALIDGGLHWTGTDRPLLVDLECVARTRMSSGWRTDLERRPLEEEGKSLAAPREVRVTGGYLGGVYSNDWSMVAWDGPRQTERERTARSFRKHDFILESLLRWLRQLPDPRTTPKRP